MASTKSCFESFGSESALLLGHLLGRKFAQLLVDKRKKLLGSRGIALLDRREDTGDAGH
jgi:hypothetical protein